MSQYHYEGYKTYKTNEDGERTMLANFEAWIVDEVRYTDGIRTETVLVIEGKMLKVDPGDASEEDFIALPRAEVAAAHFHSMGWVLQFWGSRAILAPGGGTKEDLRAAIQLSSTPKIVNVFRHTGWTKIGESWQFLHNGGAVGPGGNNPEIQVELPAELERYDLTPEFKPKEAVEAMLALVEITPKEIGWTLLAAALTPILGPTDFAVHVTGRTGTFKSEIMSLFQSLYGAEMDARHLPGSWSSTPNALEAQAYLAKDCVFVVDDFVPAGTSYQQRTYQTNADKIIRAQGNQAGRARLTDVSNLQTTMYPRGIVFSTGEDTPEGHSVRARMMIMELSPGDVDLGKLTKAQQNREKLPSALSYFVQWVAKNADLDWKTLAEAMRAKYVDIGHSRTPSMIGRLISTANVMFGWLVEAKLLTPARAGKLAAEAVAAIVAVGSGQKQYLEDADPCEMFLQTIRNVVGAMKGHFRTRAGGIPKGATLLGWTKERNDGNSEFPEFQSHGPCLGWIDWKAGEIYLDATAGLNVVKKVAGADIPLTRQTLLKRLKDSGHLQRSDETRQRNTIRINADGHSRQVLCLPITSVLDNQEQPADEE